MRNLKRALSLVLASVMLVGMMVVGTSAASFSDVDSDHNVEAISVLQALGVMNGYDDGGFHPEAKVTRNQMAMIICSLLGLDGADFTDYRPFNDVPDWAAGAVGACYVNDIVGGRGEGIYDGDAYVTGVEAAAMMLRALGYTEMPASANWETPIIQKAAEVKLFKNAGSVSSTTFLNRDEVAQVTLNALQATVVTVEKTGGTITTPDGTVVNMGGIEYKEVAESEYNYNSAKDDSDDEKYQQLCEKLYGNDLKKVSDDSDKFGRPASTWEYEKEDIITVADGADRTYVGGVKAKDIYSDLNLKAQVATDNIQVFEDTKTGAKGTQIVNSTNGEKYGKDGQTVYVYYDKDADTSKGEPVITISIVSTYLGVVVDDDYTKDNKNGIRVDVQNGKLAFFEGTGYKEDDVLLVTVSDDEIQEILGTPETVSGEVSRVGNDNALTIDKTKYPRAVQFSKGDGDVVDGIDTAKVESTYTLYLDQNGNYLAAVEDEDNTTTDLVYVVDVNKNLNVKGNKGEYGGFATVILMDGTTKDVLVTDTAAVANDVDLTAVNKLIGTVAELKYDEDDDEYTLAASADYTSTSITKAAELEAGDRYAAFVDGTTTYLNKDTVYVLFSLKDNGAMTSADNKGREVDKIDVITGGVDFDVAKDVKSAFVTKKGETTAKYIVIVTEDGYQSSAKDVVYISDAEKPATIKDGQAYKGYFVGQDEETDVNVDKSTDKNIKVQKGFFEYSEKSNGNIKLTKAVDAKAADKAGVLTGNIKTKNDEMITIGSDYTTPVSLEGTIVDLTDADKADENTYGSNVTKISDLQKLMDKKYTVTVTAYVNKDDEVEALFVTKIAGGPEDEGDKEDEKSDVKTLAISVTVDGAPIADAAVAVDGWGNEAGTDQAPKTATKNSGKSGVTEAKTVAVTATAGAKAKAELTSGTLPTTTKSDGSLDSVDLTWKVTAEDRSVCYYKLTLALSAGT